jgi:hypothetical protein
MRALVLLWLLLITSAGVVAQSKSEKLKLKKKKIQYTEVDFEEMMRRYFGKDKSHPIEGIYTVSCVITTRSKKLFSNEEKVKVVERKDNYARVAILKDWPGSKRDFIEVSLSYRDAKKYPIMGEINTLSEGKGFIYNHLEPDGSIISFSMINDASELLEGEYSKVVKRKTITYKLSYLKIFPKASDLTLEDQE